MSRIIYAAFTAILLIGCSGPKTGESTMSEMEQTEKNHEKLVRAVPPPQLETSLERKNLSKRLERWNAEDKVGYIYLVSYGKVMAFYTIRGKVSSVNSLLTTPDQIVTIRSPSTGAALDRHVVASPDLDGSYGSNGDAIFFFTAEDVYVEWRGEYLLADAPLKLTTPPELVAMVDLEE